MIYTRTNISWSEKIQTPVFVEETGNDTPEGQHRRFITAMTTLITNNWDEFDENLRTGIAGPSWWLKAFNSDHPDLKGVDEYESLVNRFDRLVEILSDAGYGAFIDSEMNAFYIFREPFVWDPSDGEHNVIEEIRTGEWGADGFPTANAAIVHCFEKFEHEGVEQETFLLRNDEYIWVTDYTSETRIFQDD